jgi:hypothetical protein
MAGLPIALLAFAAGATLVQWQPALPVPAIWMCVRAGSGIAWYLLRRSPDGLTGINVEESDRRVD